MNSLGARKISTFRLVDIFLVFLGGSLGTASRLALSALQPEWLRFPVAIFLINILGAFALGWLLVALSSSSGQTPRHQRIRLLLGTGFLGGFTTYSALASDSMLLMTQAAELHGLLYALATVLIGAVATWCGMLLASRTGRSS